jgi:hypothetical protein
VQTQNHINSTILTVLAKPKQITPMRIKKDPYSQKNPPKNTHTHTQQEWVSL